MLAALVPMISDKQESDAMECLVPFIMRKCQLLEIVRRVRHFSQQTQIIRNRFWFQLLKKEGKMMHLKSMWNTEVESLLNSLVVEKSKASKEKYKQLQNIAEEKRTRILQLWLQRCLFIYNLVFLQWRTLSTRPDVRQLESLFKSKHL